MLDEEAYALLDFLQHNHGFTEAPDVPEVDLDESVSFDPKSPRPIWKQIVPAIAQNQCLGGFLLFASIPVDVPSELLREAGRAMAVSFQIRHLQKRLEESSQRLREISEVGRIFTEVGETERTISKILELAVQSSGAETGAIIHIESEGGLTATGMKLDTIASIRFRSGMDIIERALAADRELLFSKEQLAEELSPGATHLVLDTLAAFPLINEWRCYGALILVNVPSVIFEDPGVLAMAQTIARLAAAAMTSEERQEAKLEQERTHQEMAAAMTIQENLLPRNIAFPGVEIAVLWKPSRMIGGDYYDVIDLGDSKIGIMIADVSGKGLPAGLLMATCRSYLRVMAKDLRYSPAAALSRLNRLLCDEIADNKFITAAYMIIDLNERHGTLANAGHSAPIRIDETISEIAADSGPPLGIAKDSQYCDVSFKISEGTTLLLYTDGLVEAKSNQVLLGVGGLFTILGRTRHHLPKNLLDALWTETLTFSGGREPDDDWTAVALRIGKQ